MDVLFTRNGFLQTVDEDLLFEFGEIRGAIGGQA